MHCVLRLCDTYIGLHVFVVVVAFLDAVMGKVRGSVRLNATYVDEVEGNYKGECKEILFAY